ncbi:MAG: hypothetical protein MAGBODY4_01125 [Candidatus Marinimicrobia bacterium]|nr:hypothetical protein [Candidatus Neomarinimicrobiota bacterium]
MVSLEMDGPYELSDKMVEKQAAPDTPGNYALGYLNEEGTFVVCYVGRSDDELQSKLLSWVGAIARYTHFEYSYADSAEEAYTKECHNYHDFGGSDNLYNSNHPYRKDKTDWTCPRCSFYGR